MVRVLAVDDDDSHRLLYRVWFERQGAEVVTARDGHEGLALAERQTPDVIVLDLDMPRVDGWTVLETLRAQGQTTPVVVATARAAPGDLARARRSGANGYLVKPFAMAELARTVETITGGAGRVREASADPHE